MSGFALIVFTSLDVEGVLLVILGSLISWASSFVLYGFGQLIKNVEEINNTEYKKRAFCDDEAFCKGYQSGMLFYFFIYQWSHFLS